MSAHGTFPTWRSCLMMSVDRGEAEIICSFRVFRILTQLGHVPQWGPGFCRCALHVPDAAFGLGFRYRSREGSPVPPERIERKLAAILAADVAGYSRLMGADEEGTLARLKACRGELLDPKIAEYCVRVVENHRDGILIEFP